jgi:hypothetical protein
MEQWFFDGFPEPEGEADDWWHDLLWTFAWYGKYIAIPVLIGQMANVLLVPVMEGARISLETRQVNAMLTRLVFALEAYYRDNGNYPAALDDLLGRYIAEMPLDPFNRNPAGEPFRYAIENRQGEAEGFLLYSVGPNGIDEAGRDSGDHPRGDDIRRRVP